MKSFDTTIRLTAFAIATLLVTGTTYALGSYSDAKFAAARRGGRWALRSSAAVTNGASRPRASTSSASGSRARPRSPSRRLAGLRDRAGLARLPGFRLPRGSIRRAARKSVWPDVFDNARDNTRSAKRDRYRPFIGNERRPLASPRLTRSLTHACRLSQAIRAFHRPPSTRSHRHSRDSSNRRLSLPRGADQNAP